MDTLLSRVVVFAIGCLIGFVLGYVVRSLRDIKNEVGEIHDGQRRNDERGIAALPDFWTSIALLLVVGLSVWASISSQNAVNSSDDAIASIKKNQHTQDVERCKGGVESRNVDRTQVEAIYKLAVGSIQRDANSPPLTETERAQYNAYIDRVNTFREDMYKRIKPSKHCLPYVSDDNVKPPTPPFPGIKKGS